MHIERNKATGSGPQWSAVPSICTHEPKKESVVNRENNRAGPRTIADQRTISPSPTPPPWPAGERLFEPDRPERGIEQFFDLMRTAKISNWKRGARRGKGPRR
jgi:hypothetical protein